MKRTPEQNNALHLNCDLIAKKLNKKGISVQQLLKDGFLVDWTPRNVAAILGVKDIKPVEKVLEVIATCLNEAGYSVVPVIKNMMADSKWNTVLVKELIWRSVQRSMYQKESTTELEKTSGEIDRIHKVVMRELGEKYEIEWHDFPFDPDKKNRLIKSLEMAKKMEYPEDYKEPTI